MMMNVNSNNNMMMKKNDVQQQQQQKQYWDGDFPSNNNKKQPIDALQKLHSHSSTTNTFGRSDSSNGGGISERATDIAEEIENDLLEIQQAAKDIVTNMGSKTKNVVEGIGNVLGSLWE